MTPPHSTPVNNPRSRNTPGRDAGGRNATRAFISYSWDSTEHQAWVRDLATRLRTEGIETTLDQWTLHPGDQLPHFMETSVRENDYILIVCTPRYAQRSNQRQGGVGYEGDIMTGDLLNNHNRRKFIPILREGTPNNALPTWLAGSYYIDLHGNPYNEDHYHDLTTTLHGNRPTPPPLGQPTTTAPAPNTRNPAPTSPEPTAAPAPIRILGIIADDVTLPRRDGTRGSALYTIPFQLSRHPDHTWSRMFIEHWNNPPRWTSMHRPGIASINGDRITLNGTTIEEVEAYHRETLTLAIQEANTEHEAQQQRENARRAREQQEQNAHEHNVREKAKRITFD